MITETTNRDLLRNYKELKNRLYSDKIKEIRIPQADGAIIKITLEKPKNKTQILLEKIKKKPLMHITRPDVDLFD